MPDLPSGTVTFLFTDIERSTETVAAMGNEAYADALDAHRQLLREAFKTHDGHEIGTEGDAFFVAFAHPEEAVQSAIDGQRALDGHALRVRIGMHTGEALVRAGEYVGHDVHKAKRVSDAGHGGQILLSNTTADLVRNAVDLRDLGSHRLKDLGEPQRIFQVIADGLGNEFPRLRSLESFSTNLPLLRSAFIGREREIATVRDLLAAHRLVTLTGIGGCGKTRLAQQVAAEALDDYPGGVFIVELGPISDPDLIARAAGDAVGLPTGPLGGPGVSEEEQLLTYLDGHTTLIILDNCEHLLDSSAAMVDRIQQTCPRVTVLATSREVLGVDGEQAFGVPSLEVPSDETVDSESVSLFVSRARTARPDFSITADNGPTIAEICRRLDGIPLAIEFAAARVTHLSPQQITQKLDDRFKLLTGGRRHVQRQQTLQAALDWSHDLLSHAERTLLRRLAVFPADFGLDAAEGICAAGDLERAVITDLMGSLVAKSLVLADYGGSEVRYRLLETVRAYASERLTHAGEAQLLRDRHRDWYLSSLESFAWDEALSFTAFALGANEQANVRAGLEWSEAQGRPDLVCRLLARNPWLGIFTDSNRWIAIGHEAHDLVDPEVHAACLLIEAGQAQMGFDTAGGYAVIDRAVQAAQPPCDPAVLAMVLGERGWFGSVLAAWTGDQEQAAAARRDFDEALRVCSDRSPRLAGTILIRRGELEMTLGDVAAAADVLEGAVRLLDDGPLTFADAYAKLNLATGLHVLGDGDRAARIVEDLGALQLVDVIELRSTGTHGTAAAVLCGGDPSAARDYLVQSFTDVERSPFPGVVEEWTTGAAAVLAQLGDFERASRLLSWVRSVTYDTGQIGIRTPAAHVIYAHYVGRVREALGHEAARRCRDEGQAMSKDEAVAHALEGLR